jgi:hypothetical protein
VVIRSDDRFSLWDAGCPASNWIWLAQWLNEAISSSSVEDGNTLSCYTFRDKLGSIACVVLNEVQYAKGKPVSSDDPDWLKVIGGKPKTKLVGTLDVNN